MIAYKLVNKRKDGLHPLFIDKGRILPINEWIQAESKPTKGYKYRKGWHCCFKPVAPHLSTNNRVWVSVLVEDYETYDRPESQGGQWIIAQRMKIEGILV